MTYLKSLEKMNYIEFDRHLSLRNISFFLLLVLVNFKPIQMAFKFLDDLQSKSKNYSFNKFLTSKSLMSSMGFAIFQVLLFPSIALAVITVSVGGQSGS